MNICVLIPAFNPEKTMVDLAHQLHSVGFDLLIVNDGSFDEYNKIFDESAEYAKVIGYKHNRGKGYALKYGIKHLIGSNYDGFITVDADGQHSIDDIKKVAEVFDNEKKIVLGLRDLSGDIPLRSRVGNDMSKAVYTCVTGKYLSDNQSGLRAFPSALSYWLTKIGGTHYDYEMNVLAAAAEKDLEMIQVPIKTIYISENECSHFNPVADTLRIHAQLYKNGFISSLLYILCIIGQLLIYRFIPMHTLITVASCVSLAVLCYVLNVLIHNLSRNDKALSAFRSKRLTVSRLIFVGIKFFIAAALPWALMFTKSFVLSGILPFLLIIIITYIYGRFFN